MMFPQAITRAKNYVLGHKKELFFVFLIFLLAFGIRAHLMIYQLMFEFDTYFHARIAEYVVQTLTIPSVDPLAYYQVQGGASLPNTEFFWFFTAIIFKIVTFWGPFSKDAWITAVKIYPALFGALISVGMYFLGKQMYGKKAGVTMAFFAAVVPAFVYRTMAGQFEEDSLGFLWLVIGFYFFVRAMKKAEFNKETIKNSVIAALFFSIMAWTWQMFLLVPIILIAWFPSTLALMWFRKESNEKMLNLAKNFAIAFVLFATLATVFVGPDWIGTTWGYVSSYLPVTGENLQRIETPGGDATSVFSISVGEEQRGYDFWGNKYNALIVFPFLALLIFIPYRLLRKKDDYVSFILFFWIVVTMLMAFIRLKFTYTFGLPVAAAAGIVLFEVFEWVGQRPGFEKKTVAFAFGFMFLVGIAAGSFFVAQNVPTIEQNTGWKESLYWINQNTPKDAKFFNWWDEGHWITFIGERAVSTDNRNYILKADIDLAKLVLSTSEEEALGILKDYNPDYVIVSEDLIGKLGSLGLYAYNTTNRNDPRITKYLSVGLPCSVSTDSLTKKVTYNCGGNSLTQEQYNALPSQWISQPNQVLQTTRVFIYRSPSTGSLFILNNEANNTMIVKLFFNEATLKNFEQVYSNKEVKIFKVKA
ncbi:MAG: STT3 domain-containing protein [archaeon]